MIRRFGFFSGAVLCVGAALWLLVSSGLPTRSQFTMLQIDGEVFAPERDMAAPPLTLPTLHGSVLRLEDLRGTPLILNFWATWCEPCRVEMPMLEAFWQRTGVRVVGVNVGETPAIIRPWVDTLGLTFDIVLDQDGAIAGRYALRGQPSTYVISAQGRITDVFYGPVSEDALIAALNLQE